MSPHIALGTKNWYNSVNSYKNKADIVYDIGLIFYDQFLQSSLL